MRTRLAVFVVIIQTILCLVHFFVYDTWASFHPVPDPAGVSRLQLAAALLSISFVAASILAFRYQSFVVRVFYTLAAVWLGAVNYLLFAAGLCWILYGSARLLGYPVGRPLLADALFGLAIAVSCYGLVNAGLLRVKHLSIQLPNLPESWRGRTAALVSDLHLGDVRNVGFARRIAARLRRLRPDAVFIAGDLYDGVAADYDRLAKPFAGLEAPLGTYYVTGNHEEFSDHTKYLRAVSGAGIRVLNNEKVLIDGLQVVGVHYHDAAHDERLRLILRGAGIDRGQASILLTHAPDHLRVTEEAGISLQLSGHTHDGQLFPFNWVVSRVYGAFRYGLHPWRNLLVYTSSGAGTWGPPMRVGSRPEVAVIEFR
ncbi:MAG: metallophosphoesterase [Terriglobia bacterium]